MLMELAITDFAIIDELRLTFEPGLNVLTGETGAGKSIIIDAIGTVLGGRASTEVIRTGADRATIQARFALPSDGAAAIETLLSESGIERDGAAPTLTLAREIGRTGRTVARIDGRTVPVSTLAHLGGA